MAITRHLSWLALLRFFGAAGILILLLTKTVSVSAQTVIAQTVQRTVISRTKPDYPELAIRMHIAGCVRVLASVEPDGTVRRVHAASGHAFLQGPAEQAVRQWKFSKAPVTTDTTVEVQFTLASNVTR